MAFYLEFDGNGYVTLPELQRNFIGDGTKWEIEFSAWNSGADEFAVLGNAGSTDFIILRSDNTIDVQDYDRNIPVTDVTDPNAVYRLVYEILPGNDRRFTCFENGIQVSSIAVSGSLPPVSNIGQAVVERQGSLKFLKYTDYNNSANNRNYNKQTLNGSNDTVLPDTVGGNDGTLVNFPTDNSQWVFFDDGGGAVTVDGATTIPSLTATGNASATLPQPSLSASINLTQLSATGSASATLPNPQLDAAITLNAFTATGNASVTLPQPDAIGSIVFNAPTVAGNATATLPQPTLQAAITIPVVTANGSVSATLPGFNLSASVNIPTLTATGAAQATLPQPAISASITMPSITALGAAEATEPSFTVSGSVTLQPPTVTGSASATLPQPSISGNIALPSIQASGFIIGGEIVITVELETNINEPQLSVNINEPQLSTNIDGPKLSTNITE